MSVQCAPVFQLTCLYMLLIKEVIGKRENFNPLFLGWDVQPNQRQFTCNLFAALQPVCWVVGQFMSITYIILSHTHTHTHTSKSVCLTRIFLICFGCLHIQMHSDNFFTQKKKTKDMCPSNFVAFKRVNPQSTLEFVQLPDRRRQNWNKHVPCTYFAFIKSLLLLLFFMAAAAAAADFTIYHKL